MRLMRLIRGAFAARAGTTAGTQPIDRLGLRCAAYRAARGDRAS